MTNNLNSVIVEGIISKVEKAEQAVYCTIYTNRYFKDTSGEIHKEVSYFYIEAYGRLASSCEKSLKNGTCIRVVGRLKSFQDKVVIVAEHIEIKTLAEKKED